MTIDESAKSLLDSEFVSERTRTVITNRLEQPLIRHNFFSFDQFELLKCVIEILIPQQNESFNVDIAGEIDLMLSEGQSKGWRFEWCAPLEEMYTEGLKNLDAIADEKYGLNFITLWKDKQVELLDELYKKVDEGERSPMYGFLKEFLVDVTEVYYSHPLVQVSIGIDAWGDHRE